MTNRLHGAAWIAAPVVAVAGMQCSRNVELPVADGGTGILPPPTTAPPPPDGGIPRLDAGLGGDAFPACGERAEQRACRGANDYPCNAEGFVTSVVDGCLQDAGCAEGWLALDIGDGGCFEGIGMEPAHEAFLACIVSAVGPWRCPCTPSTVTRYLGSTLEFGACP